MLCRKINKKIMNKNPMIIPVSDICIEVKYLRFHAKINEATPTNGVPMMHEIGTNKKA